jgi:hypothetical protein
MTLRFGPGKEHIAKCLFRGRPVWHKAIADVAFRLPPVGGLTFPLAPPEKRPETFFSPCDMGYTWIYGIQKAKSRLLFGHPVSVPRCAVARQFDIGFMLYRRAKATLRLTPSKVEEVKGLHRVVRFIPSLYP